MLKHNIDINLVSEITKISVNELEKMKKLKEQYASFNIIGGIMNDVKIISLDGVDIGFTNKERALEIVKKKKAYYKGKNTICLKDVTLILNDNEKKGLKKIDIPKYSLAEELISAISHGIGTLLSIAMLVLCVIYSAIHKDAYAVVSSAIYGSTSIILYTMSTLYHSFKVNNAKRFFRIIDHSSIYLLIAGTYTPYALVTLRMANTAVGWVVFGIIWTCAILGITLTSIDMNKYKTFGMILYIVMGWMIVFTFKILISNMNMTGIYLMIGAGIIYTIGAILYGIGKKVKYMHSIFHFFVVAASILFFFSIFFYVI